MLFYKVFQLVLYYKAVFLLPPLKKSTLKQVYFLEMYAICFLAILIQPVISDSELLLKVSITKFVNLLAQYVTV